MTVAAAVVAALGLGFIFRFPIPALVVLPFAGLAVVVAAKWRWGRHIALTLFVSAFLAQATAIFVNTPFTWWLRFGFFLALVGGFLLLIVWQTKEL